ncbi:TRAP transporter large permease [Emcibacter sp.]|uniref:TRAP transporter large permease n=1 Tax=Emcibacter sp. TaxID=1979954 RepID=UPI003A8FC319
MSAFILIGLLLLLIAMGLPVAIAMGLSSIFVLLTFADQSLMSLAIKFAHAMKVHSLLAVPFFILAGAFMTTGGVAKRLIDFAISLVGQFRGGLAMASVLGCMLFAAVSGSSPATVAAVGSIVIGGMVQAGYTKKFAAGVICNAGTLGILLPPSIVMVVYAAVTETSVGKLFMAGIIPGLLLTLLMMIVIYIMARRQGMPRLPRASVREMFRAGREAFWGLLLGVIVLGGIYGGIFTPTEAAAVSALYAFAVALFVYRDIGLKEVPDVLIKASKTSVMLMFVIANAYVLAFVLTTEQIPQSAASLILDADMSPWMFLLILNVLLLIAGNFMDPTAVILIVVPIVFPIAMQLGIDPIHLGIMMVINMEIGLVTPPVGLNLFVTSEVMQMPLASVIRAVAPWLLLLLAYLVLITYVPVISTFLPEQVFAGYL